MATTLGSFIVSTRTSLGLTQGQLAERVGVSAITIWRWETDRRAPHARNFQALSRSLGWTAEQAQAAAALLAGLPVPNATAA
jgi:transcriptional regulator with XRE-family HTH domain